MFFNQNRSIINMFIDNIKIIILKLGYFIEKIKTKLVFALQIIEMGFISFCQKMKIDKDKNKQ